MKELSLYILDITMNSVKAKSRNISVSVTEEGNLLTFTVEDDGCGMTPEQVEKLSDPFFTTRTTRKVGLGIPFLKMLSNLTGGDVTVSSKSEAQYEDHGTVTKATFYKNSIDFIPLGDMISTVVTLIQGSPDIDFRFTHISEDTSVLLDTRELREVLGEEVPLSSPEVLAWIREYLTEQYQEKNNA